MKARKKMWRIARMVGIITMTCMLVGCHGGSGRLLTEDPNNASDVVETPQASADGPSPAIEEPALMGEEDGALSRKIDELFTELAEETQENAELQGKIADLEEQVRTLQDACRAGNGETALPSRPARPTRSAFPSDSTFTSDAPLPPRPGDSESATNLSAPVYDYQITMQRVDADDESATSEASEVVGDASRFSNGS